MSELRRLHSAIRADQRDVVLDLVRAKPELCKDAIQEAAKRGNVNAAALVVGQSLQHFHSIVVEFARYNRLGQVTEFIDADATSSEQGWRTIDASGSGILHWAAMDGNVKAMGFWLQRLHEKLEAEDNYGQTPLLVACANGHLELVNYLLGEPRASIGARAIGGRSPILVAADRGHAPLVISLLMKLPHSIWDRDEAGKGLLHYCAERGLSEVVDHMIETMDAEARGEAFNARDNNGQTPLIRAIAHGQTGVATLLIRQPFVDLAISDINNGKTALNWAQRLGNHTVIHAIRARLPPLPGDMEVEVGHMTSTTQWHDAEAPEGSAVLVRGLSDSSQSGILDHSDTTSQVPSSATLMLLSADNSQPEAKADGINDCSVGGSLTSDWQIIGMPNGLYTSPDARSLHGEIRAPEATTGPASTTQVRSVGDLLSNAGLAQYTPALLRAGAWSLSTLSVPSLRFDREALENGGVASVHIGPMQEALRDYRMARLHVSLVGVSGLVGARSRRFEFVLGGETLEYTFSGASSQGESFQFDNGNPVQLVFKPSHLDLLRGDRAGLVIKLFSKTLLAYVQAASSNKSLSDVTSGYEAVEQTVDLMSNAQKTVCSLSLKVWVDME